MKKLLFLWLLFPACLILHGQTPLLERKITISVQNERLYRSLRKIAEAGGFTFSYSPAILEGEKIVTYDFVNKSIRQVLDQIFKGTVRYRARGRYIILTAGGARAAKKEPAIVTGYVVDRTTGERLRDVSIYDPVTLVSTVTDSYGYFEIKIDQPAPEIILSVNRTAYTDTLVVVPARERLLNIPIRIKKERIAVLADSVGSKVERFWRKKTRWFKNINLVNVDDTLYRRGQVSFVPFVGTNHRMSGHVINDYSLNVLGGYSLGVEKLEFGGLFNLMRSDMNGFQFAGLFNGVGGEMQGVQFAGVMNGNLGAARGAQFAGVVNLNPKGMEGVLVAGVGNVAAGRLNGFQIAGVFNVATHQSEVLQMAGVWNVAAKDLDGLQIGGVFNVAAKNVGGAQLAGVINIAGKDVRGAQVAGVLNHARKVTGVQIGLINIADSVKGIPIGLMSLVWKGYHKLEVSADEIFYNNLSFRTGVRQFYNIFTVGAKPSTYKEPETFWTFGYGIGSAPRLSRKLFLNLDLTANQIVQGNSIEEVNLLNKFYIGFDYQAFKKMSLAFGATLNGHITKKSFDTYPDLFSDYEPDIFYTRDLGSSHNMRMWIGGKVALRFL